MAPLFAATYAGSSARLRASVIDVQGRIVFAIEPSVTNQDVARPDCVSPQPGPRSRRSLFSIHVREIDGVCSTQGLGMGRNG